MMRERERIERAMADPYGWEQSQKGSAIRFWVWLMIVTIVVTVATAVFLYLHSLPKPPFYT